MAEIINVVTTLDSPEALDKIGSRLLEARLVSCIQIVGPIKSTYWWKGAIETTEEWMGIMKTRRDLYGRVQEEIRSLHPYETPQIEAFAVKEVLPEYGQWVMEETAVE
jgi:periplasmic divalent cation tolerance protein